MPVAPQKTLPITINPNPEKNVLLSLLLTKYRLPKIQNPITLNNVNISCQTLNPNKPTYFS